MDWTRETAPARPRASTSQLDRLLDVRSQLVQEVVAYLDDVAARAADLPTYFPAHLRSNASDGASRFDTIQQVVCVVSDRAAFDRWRQEHAEERERRRAAGEDFEHLAYDPLRAREELEGDDRTGAEPPRPLEAFEWDDRSFDRAVVLGDSGFGKSWLLRFEARRLAQAAASQLRSQSARLEDVVLPIWLPLSALGQTKGPIAEALVELATPRQTESAEPGAGWSERFRAFLRAKLGSPKGAVLLDAWDEVPRDREGLRRRLEQFARAREYRRTRILLTSRLVGYSGSPVPGAQELELLAFERRQLDGFVKAWFGDDGAAARAFLRSVRASPQIRGLARIPLLLTLLCRTFEKRQRSGLPQRRVDLYRECLDGLLRWSLEDKHREDEEEARVSFVESLLELLADVAYQLFTEGREQFDERKLRAKMRPWLKRRKPGDELYGRTADELIARLKRLGVLTPAGGDDAGSLLFLHRTFHEYLAALALSQRRNWRQVALEHVYDPRWREVLRLLGGLLEDKKQVRTYVAALLRKNAEDVFCRPLWVASAVLGITTAHDIPTTVADRLVRECLDLHLAPPDWGDRQGYRPLLVSLGTRAMAILCARLTDDDPDVRWAVAEVLGQIGTAEAVPALVEGLADPDRSVRRAVADALRHIGTFDAIPDLVTRLESDPSWWVRRASAEALGEIGAVEAVPALIARLRDDESSVRAAAAEALGHIASADAVPALVARLDDPNEDVGRAVARALGEIGAVEAVSALIARPQDPRSWVRREMAEVLGEIGTVAAVPALLGQLDDSELSVRRVAAEALGRIGVPEGAPALSRALGDAEPSVRRAAAEALGRIGATASVPALLGRLEDSDKDVGRAVAKALGEIGASEAVPVFLARLENADADVRWAVAEALGEIGAAEAVDPLSERLADPERSVRRAAAAALGRIGAAQAIPALLGRLDDPSEDVRRTAVGSLGQIGSAEAVLQLTRHLQHQDADVRRAVAEALGEIRARRAIPALVGCLDDRERSVRRAAAEALGRIGVPEAVPPLVARLGDPDRSVRRVAAEALGWIGAMEAIPTLVVQLDDPERSVRRAAAEALRQIGERQGVAVRPDYAPEAARRWAVELGARLAEAAKFLEKDKDS